MAQKEDEKHEKIIRGLLKLPGNRKCINCGSLGPQYVCTNFSTFICTLCSGIHREFLHRIKSISMAKFSVQEIAELQSGGNDRARQFFLKEWHSGTGFPNSSNPDKIREFIKLVYVQRRFTGEKVVQKSEARSIYSSSPRSQDAEGQNVNARPGVNQLRMNYAEVGGAYGNRNFVKAVGSSRRDENGGSDHYGEDQEQPESPRDPNTACGSKRETVIRQLLQPPVEKRKVNQLQRTSSSGSIKLANEASTRRPQQVQKSNSLRDLMTDPEAIKSPTAPKTGNNEQTPSKTVKKLEVQKVPAVTTAAPLIDLISGPEVSTSQADTPQSSAADNGKPATVTRSSSMSIIDLITGPEPQQPAASQSDPIGAIQTVSAGPSFAPDRNDLSSLAGGVASSGNVQGTTSHVLGQDAPLSQVANCGSAVPGITICQPLHFPQVANSGMLPGTHSHFLAQQLLQGPPLPQLNFPHQPLPFGSLPQQFNPSGMMAGQAPQQFGVISDEPSQFSLSKSMMAVQPVGMGSMNTQAMSPYSTASAYGHPPMSTNPFDLTPLASNLVPVPNMVPPPAGPARAYYDGSHGTPVWSDTMITKHMPQYPRYSDFNLHQSPGTQMPSGHNSYMNSQVVYETPVTSIRSNPFA